MGATFGAETCNEASCEGAHVVLHLKPYGKMRSVFEAQISGHILDGMAAQQQQPSDTHSILVQPTLGRASELASKIPLELPIRQVKTFCKIGGAGRALSRPPHPILPPVNLFLPWLSLSTIWRKTLPPTCTGNNSTQSYLLFSKIVKMYKKSHFVRFWQLFLQKGKEPEIWGNGAGIGEESKPLETVFSCGCEPDTGPACGTRC